MRPLVVAAMQVAPQPGDMDGTWKRFCEQVRGIRRTFPQVQLVVAPELHLSAIDQPFDEQPGEPESAAVSIPGPLTGALGELAAETGLWICPGSVYERAAGAVYNTAVVVSPSGGLAARYRKCFPWQPYEKTTAGTQFVVFDLPGAGRIGLAICYDGSFPESFRQLAWLGAEVVLHPALTSTRDRDLELVTARANAIFNQVYVVNVNAAGPHGLGQSLIVDPEGLVRQQAGPNEEIMVDVLDLDAVTRVHSYGTFGLNRTWDQLDGHGPALQLPMYSGRYQRRPPVAGEAARLIRPAGCRGTAPPAR
ncbi:MAG TPA: carbon-nitrogen hydrolase family protein [Streptosporangiaceae bacterium]|nr:carbon-nitrogen hydrolase family protein [Streptosporangiaceae bacterium]